MKRLLLIALLLVACAPPRPDSGIVVERVYTPSVSGSGFATGLCTGSAGGTTVSGSCSGTVFYSEFEKWTLIMRASSGEVWAESVTPEVWAQYDTGDTVTFDRES